MTHGYDNDPKDPGGSCGLAQVKAGDLIEAKLDLVLGNDITTPVAITAFDRAGFTRVFDREKIAIVLDHSTPCKDIKSAQLCHEAREFAKRFSIKNFFDVGEVGIEHALLPEKGLVAPGELVIGADSHTCTYGALGAFSTGVGSTDMAAGMAMGENWFKVPEAIRVELTGALRGYVSGKDVILHLIGMIGVDGALYQSLEFTGPGVASLSMDDRFTIANMAIEAGREKRHLPGRREDPGVSEGPLRTRPWQVFDADPDAEYDRDRRRSTSAPCEPTVSLPHLPSNTRPHRRGRGDADPAGRHRFVHQRPDRGPAGGCRDSARAARCATGVRCIVIPATQDIYLQALQEGLVGDLHRGGLRGIHPDLRPLPGRAHGHSGRGRAGRLHHEPQLCRPDGPRRQRGRISRARPWPPPVRRRRACLADAGADL